MRELRFAGSGIARLIALALPLSWLLGSVAGHFLGGLSWHVAILFGAIVVVTGPTVIMPLLRKAKLEPRSSASLKWEGIVNDPIGAALALATLSYLLQLKLRISALRAPDAKVLAVGPRLNSDRGPCTMTGTTDRCLLLLVMLSQAAHGQNGTANPGKGPLPGFGARDAFAEFRLPAVEDRPGDPS
ncbi:MAG: cation:proton antiporter [Janthinobacterium lividum]